MFVVNLVGGLGNQMFQYAFGQSLKHHRKLPVSYDTADLLDRTPRENVTYRDFELDIFTGAIPLATPQQTDLFRHQPVGLAERSYYRVVRRLKQARIYHEATYFKYDPAVWRAGENTYFDGYWQTEQYYQGCEKSIREAFTFRQGPTGQNRELAQQIRGQNAVAVHVRRGDYVSNALYQEVHGICSPAYYEQAIHAVTARVEQPVLYIFSDDPAWVRQHLHFDFPTVYVSHNQGENSFEDMRLMSLCQHNIIANSSFSWWGAWLNNSPSKLVVAPRQWMQGVLADATDLLPPSWIVL